MSTEGSSELEQNLIAKLGRLRIRRRRQLRPPIWEFKRPGKKNTNTTEYGDFEASEASRQGWEQLVNDIDKVVARDVPREYWNALLLPIKILQLSGGVVAGGELDKDCKYIEENITEAAQRRRQQERNTEDPKEGFCSNLSAPRFASPVPFRLYQSGWEYRLVLAADAPQQEENARHRECQGSTRAQVSVQDRVQDKATLDNASSQPDSPMQ